MLRQIALCLHLNEKKKKSVKDLFNSNLQQLSSRVQGRHHSGYIIDSSYISSIPVRNLKTNCQTRHYMPQNKWDLGKCPSRLQKKLQVEGRYSEAVNHTELAKTERKMLSSYNDFFFFYWTKRTPAIGYS